MDIIRHHIILYSHASDSLSLSLHSGVVSFMRHAPSTFLSTTDAADAAAAAGGRTFRLSKGFSALFL